MKKFTLFFTILISLLAVQLSFAAPSLTITKPPVTPIPSWTGPGSPPLPIPPGDPDAIFGQWFVDRASGTIFANRTHEFYDNVLGMGGGLQGSMAIYGFVSAVTWAGPGTPITAFDIDATIINDIPADTPWQPGANSHLENRAFTAMDDQQMFGSMYDVKLTAEFSIDPTVPFPVAFVPPYFDPYPGIFIEAVNHDELAWYCWTPDNPEPLLIPWGDFHVPTWDFGDIPQGGTANKVMSFAVPAGLLPTDPRYGVVTNSLYYATDVLINRTTSLKISDWIEDLVLDIGAPYPGIPEHNSDVSVFHFIPEPGIYIGISLMMLTIFRKFTR